MDPTTLEIDNYCFCIRKTVLVITYFLFIFTYQVLHKNDGCFSTVNAKNIYLFIRILSATSFNANKIYANIINANV